MSSALKSGSSGVAVIIIGPISKLSTSASTTNLSFKSTPISKLSIPILSCKPGNATKPIILLFPSEIVTPPSLLTFLNLSTGNIIEDAVVNGVYIFLALPFILVSL